MKKRIACLVLILALVSSLAAVMTIPMSAARITDKTDSALKGELTQFVKNAQSTIAKDDYQKIPGATKHPLTEQLEQKLNEAMTLMAELGKTKTMDDVEAFLVDLFGGWEKKYNEDGEYLKDDYKDSNLPFTELQNALMVRWAGIDEAFYQDEQIGYLNLVRAEYTIESWEKVMEVIDYLDGLNVPDSSGIYPITTLTRSIMAEKYEQYKEAVAGLVKVPADKVEQNRVRGLLHDVLFRTYKDLNWTWEDLYNTCQEDPNLPILKEFKDFIEGAYATYENENATIEEMTKYVDLEEKTKVDAEGEPILDDDGKEQKYFEYEAIINGKIQEFRDSLFVGTNAREAKNAIYYRALDEFNAGKYTQENWDIFMKCFEPFDAVIGDYKTPDVIFRQLVDDIKEAYDVLKATAGGDPRYVVVYNEAKEFVASEDKTKYTEATWDALERAISYYEEAAKNPDADENELYELAVGISVAKGNLVLVTEEPVVDTVEELRRAIAISTQIVSDAEMFIELADEDMYTSESLDAVKDALSALKEQLNLAEADVRAFENDPKKVVTRDSLSLLQAIANLYTAQVDLVITGTPNTSND